MIIPSGVTNDKFRAAKNYQHLTMNMLKVCTLTSPGDSKLLIHYRAMLSRLRVEVTTSKWRYIHFNMRTLFMSTIPTEAMHVLSKQMFASFTTISQSIARHSYSWDSSWVKHGIGRRCDCSEESFQDLASLPCYV